LKTKISEVENQLKAAQERRTAESQITALEQHLSNLRTKLVDELIEDTPAAIAAVEQKKDAIIRKLENKDVPGKELTEVQVKDLNDQLGLLQAKLADLVAGTGNNTTDILKQEIEAVCTQLISDQQNRLPDSQIKLLEEHLGSLRTKLVECLLRNDYAASESLKTAIEKTMEEIDLLQKSMGEAAGLVNKSTKVNDAIDAFVSTITTIPTGASYPPFVTACLREQFLNNKFCYILKIKLMSSGADFITEEPPFYSRVVKTSYMGGGVVSYVMADRQGRIVTSGTVAGVSALEHTIGKEPKLLQWRGLQESAKEDGKNTFFPNLLIASSLLFTALALIGAAIGIGAGLQAGASGLGTGLSPLHAFLNGNETALPLLFLLLIIQPILTILALRSDRLGTVGVIGLTFLGLLFGIGMLVESIHSEIFGQNAINLLNIVLGIGLIIVPFTMMVLGLLEWGRRNAETKPDLVTAPVTAPLLNSESPCDTDAPQ